MSEIEELSAYQRVLKLIPIGLTVMSWATLPLLGIDPKIAGAVKNAMEHSVP